MDALVEISEDDVKKLKGKVADVGVSANILSRTYTVRIAVTNGKAEVLPECYAMFTYPEMKEFQG
jgi:hypothetical protein